MNDRQLLDRITFDPAVMRGKPVVRGTRLTVETVLNQLAHGAAPQELLDEYPGLTPDDLRACLLFAATALSGWSFAPLAA